MKLSALARRNVWRSKSIIFIIGLAAMLICVVINLAFSIQQAMIEDILETVGNNHAVYSNITPEQAEILSMSREVELADLHLILRDVGIPVSGRRDQIGLIYSSELGQVAGFRLISGNPPLTEIEAAMPPHVAALLGIEPEVGAEFDLTIMDMSGRETTRRFTVSGILQPQRLRSAMNAYPMFISETLAQQFENDLHLFVRFNNTTFARTTANTLAERIGGIPERDFALNELYLSANLQDVSMAFFAAVVLTVICAAGALAIFNAFNLSVVRRIHQYGLLTVIGASQKQLQGCLRLEALLSSFLGLPFGLIAGTFAGYWGVMALSSSVGMTLSYMITPVAYFLSVVVTLVMVFAGITHPVRKASHIAPVEAVRFSNAADKSYERETVKNVTMNALVKVNISRSKKRVAGTVLAFSISGILLLAFSAVTFSIRDSADAQASQMVPGDIVVTAGFGYTGFTQQPDPLSRELVETIHSLDGVIGMISVKGVRLVETKDAYPSVGSVIGISADALQIVIDSVYDGNPSLADFSVPENVIAVMHSEEQVDIYKRD